MKHHRLFSHEPIIGQIAHEQNLRAAWRAVRANRGGAGVDGLAIAAFAQNEDTHLIRLRRDLIEGRYVPLPLRRATVSKTSGGKRPLAIPTVTDRIAQRAALQILEPVLEREFLPCSYAYRPGRGVAEAVAAVQAHRQAGRRWILDGDITDFFARMDHRRLLVQLRRVVSDPALIRLVDLWLRAPRQEKSAATVPSPRPASPPLPYADEDALLPFYEELPREERLKRLATEAVHLAWEHRRTLLPLLTAPVLKGALAVTGGVGVAAVVGVAGVRVWQQHRRVAGVPQGSPLSPLLANLYLHAFDQALCRAGFCLVRYADDFVVCYATRADALRAYQTTQRVLRRLHLCLHPEKTVLRFPDDPLCFLGQVLDSDGVRPAAATAQVKARLREIVPARRRQRDRPGRTLR